MNEGVSDIFLKRRNSKTLTLKVIVKPSPLDQRSHPEKKLAQNKCFLKKQISTNNELSFYVKTRWVILRMHQLLQCMHRLQTPDEAIRFCTQCAEHIEIVTNVLGFVSSAGFAIKMLDLF